MPSAYLLGGCRTPIGKFMGGLASVPATQLGAIAIREALARTQADPSRVDEVIMGNVVSAGLGQAPARQAAIAGGVPASVPALTINKVCGSGLKAVMLADQAIRAGDASVIVAGGMESMSRAPHLLMGSRTGWKYGHQQTLDALVHDGLWCAFENVAMGVEAEGTARERDVSRQAQDHWAAESHRRAVKAIEQGAFSTEIVPVLIPGKKGPTTVGGDEGPRPDTTLERLSALEPAFVPGGTVTAGNASQISDGAAAVVVASERIAREYKGPVKARIVASAASGVAPKDLFIAPISAMQEALRRAELKPEDVDLIELNEAFAAPCVACVRPLGFDPARVNVNGGAIALGHPIGASGARILVTLLHALAARGLRRGLASLCLGGGNAVALVMERVD
jgi:acetyl-CoA C-acetyltransferase